MRCKVEQERRLFPRSWRWPPGIGRLFGAGATAITSFMSLVPGFASVLAWAILGEIPRAPQVIGAALVTLGPRFASAK